MGFFQDVQDFNALSVCDLLTAREQFHFQLAHKKNVVGTAIGRYRIRKSDPPPAKAELAQQKSPAVRKTKRTLENSEVRDYSWPAILVFVDKWLSFTELHDPNDAIPRAIYLPDGRRVPICVIESGAAERAADDDQIRAFPGSLIGGGFPLICDVQNRSHMATVGCLVTDGHRTYAMTNKHVCGEPGQVVSALAAGNKKPIGTSASIGLGRVGFQEIYPGWPGKNVYVHADIGLIDIDDLNAWSTQVYGVGEIGRLLDIDISNLSLHLIGCPVRAYGAAGGDMRGEICALFYRFKEIGGFEYVSDLLIGPRKNLPLGTRPGDSGALWMVDDPKAPEDKMCLGLQWGGQVFDAAPGGKSSTFALATFLSTTCNVLDVDLVRGWNVDNPDYWGAVGHYGIANIAVNALKSPKLAKLMGANLENISYQVGDITKKNMQGLSTRDFVPLADVPDMVWKVGPHKRGGMKAPEHANHFADMDRKLSPGLADGATLLEICKKSKNVAVGVWQKYYDAVKKQYPKQEESRGLLPFRVWQIYKQMVAFAAAGNVEKFVCAAGILSHYVGDSCQPLHISYLFNGDPDRPVKGTVRGKNGAQEGLVSAGTGVHSAYEDDMIDRHVTDVMAGVAKRVKAAKLATPVKGGYGAACAVVGLMQQTFEKIKPMAIVDAYIAVESEKPAQRADALWASFGETTMDVMADGCMCLALLWESAWAEGNGNSKIKSLEVIEPGELAKIYQDPQFLPTMTLDTISKVL